MHWPVWVIVPLVLAVGALFGACDGRADPAASGCSRSSSRWPACSSRAALCYLISIDSISITDRLSRDLAISRADVGGASLSVGALIAIVAAGRGDVRRALHAVRPQRLCDRRQRAVGAADGPAGARARKIGVYTLSGFCSALGGVVFTFYMLSGYGLHAAGHGARRDRRGGDRRHAAHRRRRAMSSARCSAC